MPTTANPKQMESATQTEISATSFQSGTNYSGLLISHDPSQLPTVCRRQPMIAGTQPTSIPWPLLRTQKVSCRAGLKNITPLPPSHRGNKWKREKRTYGAAVASAKTNLFAMDLIMEPAINRWFMWLKKMPIFPFVIANRRGNHRFATIRI